MRFEKDLFYYKDEFGEEQVVGINGDNGEPEDIISIEPIGYLNNEVFINTSTASWRAEWLKKAKSTRVVRIDRR